jgi:hypothetical protein
MKKLSIKLFALVFLAFGILFAAQSPVSAELGTCSDNYQTCIANCPSGSDEHCANTCLDKYQKCCSTKKAECGLTEEPPTYFQIIVETTTKIFGSVSKYFN